MPTFEQVMREAADERAKKEAARFQAAGGPAFPCQINMAGKNTTLDDRTFDPQISKWAYEMADAMLKARSI